MTTPSAPTVDTPTDDERITRLRDFVDRFGNDPSFSVSITDVAFLLSALLAARREVEAQREDAQRYRALSDAIGDELIEVYDLRKGDEHAEVVIGSLGLEALCWCLEGEQAAALAATPESPVHCMERADAIDEALSDIRADEKDELLTARREVEARDVALRRIAQCCWDTVETNGLGEDDYADALLHASALARAALAATPEEK